MPFILKHRSEMMYFEVSSRQFRRGLRFSFLAGVLYKTKTLTKIDKNRKSCFPLFCFSQESCLSLFQVISRRFWRGLFLGLRSSFCTHPTNVRPGSHEYNRWDRQDCIKIRPAILLDPWLWRSQRSTIHDSSDCSDQENHQNHIERSWWSQRLRSLKNSNSCRFWNIFRIQNLLFFFFLL